MPTLTWNANTEPDLAGYKIYHSLDVNNFTDPPTTVSAGATSLVVTGLNEERNNYYTISAFDITGNESAQSGAVEWSNRSQQLRIVARYIRQYAAV